MSAIWCVDVGSTFTKGVLVDPTDGRLLHSGATPTTVGTDVLEGIATLRGRLPVEPSDTLVCSSAGGGLRLAVVGYEREVTGEAGHRVGLSAGARVVHVAAGELDRAGLAALRARRPDIILLVGGTDGGNADVLLHNATRLARARITVPIVAAGNADARDEVAAVLDCAGRRFVLADNVVPRIGVIDPDSARAAIRTVFLEHVIGGKGLSRGPEFARMVRAATPDAVLTGVEVLAGVVGDVIVVDVGGATTDVYSALVPQGEDAEIHRDVVGHLWQERTVEADLGMRWSAPGVVEAAARERLSVPEALEAYALAAAADPGHLPRGAAEVSLDLALARIAAVVAARRHGRPATPSEAPRPLADVGLVIGSGGVLRHNEPDAALDVVRAVTTDHGGGWRVPEGAQVAVDTAYLLFAVGLLAEAHPDAARSLAGRVVGPRA
ncbi:glutamate mutase [Nostocoides sp. F2B08]|uniref:glutamate mutase L n=1 Tax=Nostocoides sp. F2B08 TaxID=2653936 RepID=UPI001262E79D|nr:glutamate mutase L [Tetrasphaera sp. F2B08]KAB7743545.1 glutamate mutase [Tetrasphaera sp. F2B08]